MEWSEKTQCEKWRYHLDKLEVYRLAKQVLKYNSTIGGNIKKWVNRSEDEMDRTEQEGTMCTHFTYWETPYLDSSFFLRILKQVQIIL